MTTASVERGPRTVAEHGRRRSVLLLVPTLQGGGSERVMVNLARHLDRTQFELTIAVLDGRKPAFRADLPADVTYIDLKCRRVRYSAPFILRLIWKRRPDVVMSTLGHLNLGIALLRPLYPRSTRFVARESVVVSQILWVYRIPRLWKFAYRMLYHRFDRVVCQSVDMQRDLVEEYSVPEGKTTVIYNPVELDRVRSLSLDPVRVFDVKGAGVQSPIHLIAVGRLEEQKGFDLLIEAVARSGRPRLHLTILGEGSLQAPLEALASRLGIGPRVRFAGFQRNPYPYLRQAHAFVLSSRFEGLPNVLLEALACGTPVIATPAPGGIHEVLKGRSGCAIAKAISAEALATVLTRYDFDAPKAPQPMDEFAAERISARYGDVLLAVTRS